MRPHDASVAGGRPVYDAIGRTYAQRRRADPRIAARIHAALAEAQAIVNVGAGTGSYEPSDRELLAVEPSAVMLAQRPPGAAPAIRARAEALPFVDGAFDAAMAVLTLHHWSDKRRGLQECVRVARRRVIVLTIDAEVAQEFWLMREYFPELHAIDRARLPPMATYIDALGAGTSVTIEPVMVDRDCVDGFLGAYWARPRAYLDPEVRAGMSVFAGAPVDKGLARLRGDLDSGAWHDRHGALMNVDAVDLGYRLVVAEKQSVT